MPQGAPPFHLHLLGSPRVEGPEGAVDLALGKPLAVLCYLALEPSVRRSDVARVLWPSSTPARAKASVRQAIWLLRKQTRPDVLIDEDRELQLNREQIHVDLDDFDADLRAGRLKDALARWDGGPLRGLSVPDAPPWITWADDVRSRWEASFGTALEERAAVAEPAARPEWLEAAVEVRPHRVPVWVELVQAWVDLREGDKAEEALARLRTAADSDDRAFVEDAEERVRLLRRSAYGDPSERLAPDFVGRSREFSALMTGWRRTLGGRTGFWALVGPAGIGKSALAAEVIRHVGLDGGTLVEAQAVLAEQELDFGVVATLVSDLLRRPGAAGTSPGSSNVLKSLVPSKSDGGRQAVRPTALADALADLLGAVSHESPLLLVVDDAHWMDRSSALVLLRAIRQLDHADVMMVWTCRSADDDGASPALEAIEAAREQDLVTVLGLAPLAEGEVREMITLLLAGNDPAQLETLVGRIHLASGGSPLHIIETLRGLRDQGLLGLDSKARWTLAEDAAETVLDHSPSLLSVLNRRLDELSPDARRVAAALAEEGGARSPDFLQSYRFAEPTEVGPALTELLERGVVRWTRDDRLDFSHGTLAKALLELQRREHAGSPEVVEPPPVSKRKRPTVIWALPAVALVVLIIALMPPAEPEAAPFGGGTIWIRAESGFVPARYVGGDDPWVYGDPVDDIAGVVVQVVRDDLGAPGEPPVVGGYTAGDLASAPEAVLIRGDRVDTVAATVGDDAVRDLSPTGRAALANLQHPDTFDYRQTVVRIDLAPPYAQRVLLEGPIGYISTDWSADGRYIAAIANAAQDSIIIADPAGRRVAATAFPEDQGALLEFCGSDAVIVGAVPEGELTRYWRWDFLVDAMSTLETSLEPLQQPACSPDGSVLVYLHDAPMGAQLILEDWTGTILDRTVLPFGGASSLRWGSPGSGPDGVQLVTPPQTLARGQRVQFEAAAYAADGSPMDRNVTWASSAPGIASVDALGRVTANRAGETTVVARVDGWLTDSVGIVVTNDAVAEALVLSDSFPRLDPSRWHLLGDPQPRPVVDDEGRPSLYLNGDGRFHDGIASVEAFDLRTGGTLEATFRMTNPFHRRDRNRIGLCLRDGEPGDDPSNLIDWTERQGACVVWPTGHGVDFRPDAIQLSAGNSPVGAITSDSLLRTERWQRMAIQIRADGVVSATVNDSVVGVHPLRLRNDSTVRWHAVVEGHSVGNELLMRDLTLWREERLTSLVPAQDTRPSAGGGG